MYYRGLETVPWILMYERERDKLRFKHMKPFYKNSSFVLQNNNLFPYYFSIDGPLSLRMNRRIKGENLRQEDCCVVLLASRHPKQYLVIPLLCRAFATWKPFLLSYLAAQKFLSHTLKWVKKIWKQQIIFVYQNFRNWWHSNLDEFFLKNACQH